MFWSDSDFRFPISGFCFCNRVVAATAPRMTAANPFRRQRASGKRAVQLQGVNRVLRAGRREPAAGVCAEQKNLRRRNRPAINADSKNQNMLEQIHSIFQKLRAVQRRQKILFHLRKFFSGDGIARDQNQFHRLRELMLMLPETFPQQTPRAVTLDCTADFFARDNAQFRLRAVRQPLPVGDETTQDKSLTLLADARKIAARPDARGAAQTFRRFSGRRHAKSNRRQAFAAVAAAVGQRGLAALARIAVEKSVLAFAADF